MTKNFILAIMVLLLIPSVFATTTTINVVTEPFHDVTLNVLEPTSLDALQTIEKKADNSGLMTTAYASGHSQLAFSVIIRKDGKIVVKKSFDKMTTGGSITLDAKAETTPVVTPPAPVVNTTPAANPIVNNVSNSTNQSNITGNAVSGPESNKTSWTNSFSSKTLAKIGYYAIGLVVLVILIIIIYWIIGKIKENRHSIRKPSVPWGHQYNASEGTSDRDLAQAERKIREAQAEIDRIRNKKAQMIDARRRFEEARRDLERFRE